MLWFLFLASFTGAREQIQFCQDYCIVEECAEEWLGQNNNFPFSPFFFRCGRSHERLWSATYALSVSWSSHAPWRTTAAWSSRRSRRHHTMWVRGEKQWVNTHACLGLSSCFQGWSKKTVSANFNSNALTTHSKTILFIKITAGIQPLLSQCLSPSLPSCLCLSV